MSGGNPKDFVGASKSPMSTVSRRVIHELGLAMLEGECKYWRHNYRAARVRVMVYMDALERHVSAFIEGQDIDPESGLPHLIKAMACLAIVRDAQIYGSLIDDRPPAQADPNWLDECNAKAKAIIESTKKFERGAFTEANRDEWATMCADLDSGPIKRLPKLGDAVRVVEIAPFDEKPYHACGVCYENVHGIVVGNSVMTCGWSYLRSEYSGTWCRLELV